MSNILVYTLENKIYINLTNRCTNDCIFCLRKDKDDVCGQKLWLDSEDFGAEDVIEQFNKILQSFAHGGYKNEVVFCGYGEPLLKLDILKTVAKYIKDNYPQTKIRINTNGHANYVYKRNIAPELKGLIDEISVSLNGSTSAEYDELSQPKFENAYDEVKILSSVVLSQVFIQLLLLLTDIKAEGLIFWHVQKLPKISGLI